MREVAVTDPFGSHEQLVNGARDRSRERQPMLSATISMMRNNPAMMSRRMTASTPREFL
jgi:hypothetical protein